jgi:protein involved in polysaccharide export with SLBB domain
MFTLPFAGDIKAAGRPIPEIRREIEARLAKRAIEPAVEVTLIKRNSPGQCLP